jgi:raffinose/stachyose/melibiose transport system permease protein
MMLPFYILFNTAFKNTEEALSSSALALPTNPTLEGFSASLATTGSRSLIVGALNSLIITVGSVVLLIIIGSLAAFVIIRRPGKISKTLLALFLLAIILPAQLGLIPVYIGLRSLGLVGTHIGMIIMYTGLLMPLSVFLYTGFVRTLPRDYEEAAQIDGASPFATFRKIVFPLLGPATGTVAILTSLIIWNDFFTSLVFLSGSDAVTLPVVVYSFVGELVSKWNVIFAAVILSMIPFLVFYLFAQKKFIQGFAGGIKS